MKEVQITHTMYECSYCGQRFDTKEECQKHEKEALVKVGLWWFPETSKFREDTTMVTGSCPKDGSISFRASCTCGQLQIMVWEACVHHNEVEAKRAELYLRALQDLEKGLNALKTRLYSEQDSSSGLESQESK